MHKSFSLLTALVLVVASFPARAADSDVVINEILYNPAGGNTGNEYLELFNAGASTVDLAGWTLSDAVTFTFPAQTTISAGGYLVVCADAASAKTFYGIATAVGDWVGRLDNAGENVVLRNETGTVIAQASYSDGSHPIGSDPWPTEADGAGPSLELFSPELDAADPQSWGIGQPYTPGALNAATLPADSDIVITEIMYKPQKKRLMENLDPRNGGYWWEDGDDPQGQYVEVFNRGKSEVDLSGWSLADGVLFTFPAGIRFGPGEYLAVCGDVGYVSLHYSAERTIGDFTGSLSNAGERVTLVDGDGRIMDTVRYRDDPPWPIGPDQTGQSLEILDPRSPNDRGDNWRASAVPEPEEVPLEFDCNPEELPWERLEVSGMATSNRLYFYTNGAGEWLVDKIEIRPQAGADIMQNGSFDPDDSGWQKTGNHAGTFRTTEDAIDGDGCEHIVSTSSGLSSSNSLNRTVSGMVEGQNYTISFWAKHVSGGSLTFRLSGGGLPAVARGPDCDGLLPTQSPLTFLVGMEQTLTRGTPGASNAVSSEGIPPLVQEWTHTPQRPRSSDHVVVTARVSAAEAATETIDSVVLEYEALDAPFRSIDQAATVRMSDNGFSGDGAAGDGVFGATIPRQGSQSLVRYRITATDSGGRSWTWPDGGEPNPNGAYFVYDGEADTKLDAYFLILSTDSLRTLSRDPEAKRFVDATLVAEGVVYDHIGLRYRSDRNQPKKSHKIRFNKHEYFRGVLSSLDTNYDWPVTEKVATNLFFLMGQTNIAMEVVRIYQNGLFIGVYAARESPNRSWLRSVGWDENSEIYKSKSSDGCCSGFDPTHPNCPNGSGDFCASNLHWKSFYSSSLLPRMYIKRSDSLGFFQTLEDFIFDLRDIPNSQLVPYVENNAELYDWLYKAAVHSMQPHCDYHAKNFYVVRKPEGLWDVLFFDYDRFWGCRMFGSCHAVDTSPKCSGTAFNAAVYENSELNERFYHVLKDVAENLLTEDAVSAMLDQWFDDTRIDRAQERARVAGAKVSPDSSLSRIKNFFAARRNWILNSYLPSRLDPLANEHPLVAIAEITAATSNQIAIEWTWSDVEGDPATIDLFWTDLGFRHFVPIPNAQALPAGAGGQGGFVWSGEIPDLGRKTLYLQAVIDDGNGPMVGRSNLVAVTFLEEPPGPAVGPFLRGDCNEDGEANLSDVIFQLLRSFAGGAAPTCLAACDFNRDGNATGTTLDAVTLLHTLFRRGAPLPGPFPLCGDSEAPTDLALDCETSNCQ